MRITSRNNKRISRVTATKTQTVSPNNLITVTTTPNIDFTVVSDIDKQSVKITKVEKGVTTTHLVELSELTQVSQTLEELCQEILDD
ncbi:MAG: hypothetical protein RR248_03910 [Clostridia bacterium]